MLSEQLSDSFRVIAVDGWGAGKSPDWPAKGSPGLEDEVKLLGAALDRAGEQFHLVGHSYGGAVAMKIAVMYPRRVRSIVVYEPTLFHLVAGGDPLGSPAAGIWQAATDAAESVEQGDNPRGAKRFIDFWMGSGAWDAMPPARQTAVAVAVRNVKGWRDALFNETVPLSALSSLDVPVLCMWGDQSPQSSLSVAMVLRETLKRVVPAPQPGLGHMGPITDPERVNAQIAEFLRGI
jgi:pimeloyl-ACP methyl ester carboxylesterase